MKNGTTLIDDSLFEIDECSDVFHLAKLMLLLRFWNESFLLFMQEHKVNVHELRKNYEIILIFAFQTF